MAKGKVRNFEEGFTSDEEKIISDFLNGMSIRKISETSKLGRTAIKNLLIDYSKVKPELKDKIDERLFGNKNHKEMPAQEIREISQEQLIQIYNGLMNGEITLRQASLDTGRNREYIRKRIIEYLGDDSKVQEFLVRLKQNQSSITEREELEKFLRLSETR